MLQSVDSICILTRGASRVINMAVLQAKKIKSSKVKKVHLFRDGFTLPSAAEPDDDSDQAPPLLKLQGDGDGGRLPCKAAELPVSYSLLNWPSQGMLLLAFGLSCFRCKYDFNAWELGDRQCLSPTKPCIQIMKIAELQPSYSHDFL